MSKKGRYTNKNRSNNKASVGDKAKEVLENIDDDNPTIQMFRQYAKELDDKHDRHERLVKLSRDITIESKRIIFLLHNSNTDIESKRDQILDEANTRLVQLVAKNFKLVAKELQGFDAYQYHRAYTAGVQEYVEALVFYQYIKSQSIEPFTNVETSMQFTEEENGDGETFNVLIPHYDFILGLCDFTGELMRRCINNLGVGNINECFSLCSFVKVIYTGFLGTISTGCKEIGRKVYTLKQSLAKMELVCYNIQIRGSEIPKHMLASVIESAEMDNTEDEGFF